MRHTRYRTVLLSLATAAACTGERVDDQAVQTTTADGQLEAASGDAAERRGMSMVRLVNALPTGAAASVSVDDRAMFTAVDYKAVTPYTELRDNVARFRLQGGGRDTTIASNNELMLDGARYTLVALPRASGEVSLRVVRDDLGSDTTRARLRIIHGVSGVDELDVLFQGKTDPVFDNVNLASEAGFKDVDPLSTTLLVRADGSGRQLLRKELRFEPGHSYTVVLTGTAQRAEAIVVDDQAMPVGSMGAMNGGTPLK